MDADAVVNRLKRDIEAAGGLRRWSRMNEISPSYVSRVCRQEKDLGDKILDALGLERIVTYRRKNGEART